MQACIKGIEYPNNSFTIANKNGSNKGCPKLISGGTEDGNNEILWSII
jgi:hypothetical protein